MPTSYRNVKIFVIIEIVLFAVAGVITVVLGEFTIVRYGTILLLCGLVPMAIGVVSDATPRYRPMPTMIKPNVSVAEQHEREKKELLGKTAFLQNALIVGVVPVGVGLLLMWL